MPPPLSVCSCARAVDTRALTIPTPPLVRSLAWNKIRYEGVTKLAEVLCQTNITTLE